MSLTLKGHAVAPGVVIGRVHLAERNELEIGEYRIREQDVEHEIQRYRNAVDAAREQLNELAERIHPTVAVPAVEIIQSHVLMLGDSKIRKSTEIHIREKLCNAEWALQSQLEQVLSEFRSMDDEYIRTRGEDVTQVVRLIQSKLSAESAGKHDQQCCNLQSIHGSRTPLAGQSAFPSMHLIAKEVNPVGASCENQETPPDMPDGGVACHFKLNRETYPSNHGPRHNCTICGFPSHGGERSGAQPGGRRHILRGPALRLRLRQALLHLQQGQGQCRG